MEGITENRMKKSVFVGEGGHQWNCECIGKHSLQPLLRGTSAEVFVLFHLTPRRSQMTGKYICMISDIIISYVSSKICAPQHERFLKFFLLFAFLLLLFTEHAKYNKQQLLFCWSSKHHSPSSVFKNSYWQSTAKQHHQHWSFGYETGK